MPRRPAKFCGLSGCYRVVHPGTRYCPIHTREKRRALTQGQDPRGSTERGYDRRWRKSRLSYLKANPLCVACAPRVVAATVVDHIVPHKGSGALFWDPRNWQALCKPCHDRKTAHESIAAPVAG